MLQSAMHAFVHFTLRTTDVDSARAFYAAVLGGGDADVLPLHEQAVARGVPAHWLGYVGVSDVERAAEAFIARGAGLLSGKVVRFDGLSFAVVRGPGGAVLGLAKVAEKAPRADAVFGARVVFHVIHSVDALAAKAAYAESFGWALEEPIDLGSLGVLHPFAWEAGGAVAGAFADVSARPGVHPHVLFHLQVPSLSSSLEAVSAGGGVVAATIALPNGARVGVCEDPQGAAFALIEGNAL